MVTTSSAGVETNFSSFQELDHIERLLYVGDLLLQAARSPLGIDFHELILSVPDFSKC